MWTKFLWRVKQTLLKISCKNKIALETRKKRGGKKIAQKQPRKISLLFWPLLEKKGAMYAVIKVNNLGKGFVKERKNACGVFSARREKPNETPRCKGERVKNGLGNSGPPNEKQDATKKWNWRS